LINFRVPELVSADSVSFWNILQPTGAGVDRKSGTLIMTLCSKVVSVPAMKAYMGVDVWLHVFITSALGEWSTSRAGRFMSKEKPVISTELENGWTPESVLKFWTIKKVLLLQGIEPQTF